MNKSKSILSVIAIYLACLTGCVTSPTGQKTPDIARIAAVTLEATAFGVEAALANDPSLAGPFSQALASLTLLESSKTVTPAILLEVVHKIPVKQLQGSNATLAFGAATILLASTGWSTIDVVQLSQLLPIVTALKEGLITAGVQLPIQ